MNYALKLLLALTLASALLWLTSREAGSALLLVWVLLISGLYIFGLMRLWRTAGIGHGLAVWRAACFLAGMLILMLTLSTSMDELADRTFSFHMIQHMVLINMVAPLLLLGEFSPTFLWAVGKNAARWTTGMWTRSPRLGRFWKRLTQFLGRVDTVCRLLMDLAYPQFLPGSFEKRTSP